MALSANTVLEVRTGGSNTNGGGFVTGASGTDWSQQNAAQYAVADGVTAGTTTITSATANFGTDVVGNIMYVAGGTGSVVAGWYQITARTNSTTITVDRSTGLTAGTGVTLNIGGALADAGQAFVIATVSGMKVYQKGGTYNFSTATPGAGGPIAFTTAINLQWIGYDQSRGDHTGTRPVISWASVSAPGSNTFMCVMATGASLQAIDNITLNGNSVNNVSGFSCTNISSISNSIAENCTGASAFGFSGSSGQAAQWIACQALTCTVGLQGNTATAIKCYATGGTTGINVLHAEECLAYSNTTNFSMQNNACTATRCTADSGTTGFNAGSTVHQAVLVDCLASNASGNGFTVAAGTTTINCAAYNNGTNVSGTAGLSIGQVALTQQPYVTAGSQFAPNTTTGGGVSLRGAGTPTATQTDNKDIGAVQHADPLGGIFIVEG